MDRTAVGLENFMRQPLTHEPTTTPIRGAAIAAVYFWPIITLLLVVRLLIDSSCNLVPDEAFYWTWTRHLATGYFDHPPMVAWLIWLGTRLLGNTEMGVRLPATVTALGALVVLVMIARRILPDLRAVGFVILMWICGPLLAVTATIITPDAPALLFSACGLACVVKIAAMDDDRPTNERRPWTYAAWPWIGFGLFCGLAFLSKYTTVLLPASAALAFVTSRRGLAHFRRPWIYLAGVISIAVFSPCILWNAHHHWASFAFQLNHGAGGGLTEGVEGFGRRFLARLGGLGEFVGGQAVVWTPILFGMAIILLVAMWAYALRRMWSHRPAGWLPLFDPDASDPLSRHVSMPAKSGGRTQLDSNDAAKLGRLQRISCVDWLLLWTGTFPLVFFGYMATRSHGEINWPAFAYFPISLLMARYFAENWTGVRVQWARIGCQVALGFLIGVHGIAVRGIQQWLLRRHVHLTHQVTDLWGWKEFGRQLTLDTIGLTVVCNRHQDAGEAAFYMANQPDVWCDGVGSRTTAFDFFDSGAPDYAQLSEVAFVGGHVDLFKKKHGYPFTREVTELMMPGLGKNREHTVTIVGR